VRSLGVERRQQKGDDPSCRVAHLVIVGESGDEVGKGGELFPSDTAGNADDVGLLVTRFDGY